MYHVNDNKPKDYYSRNTPLGQSQNDKDANARRVEQDKRDKESDPFKW